MLAFKNLRVTIVPSNINLGHTYTLEEFQAKYTGFCKANHIIPEVLTENRLTELGIEFKYDPFRVMYQIPQEEEKDNEEPSCIERCLERLKNCWLSCRNGCL